MGVGALPPSLWFMLSWVFRFYSLRAFYELVNMIFLTHSGVVVLFA